MHAFSTDLNIDVMWHEWHAKVMQAIDKVAPIRQTTTHHRSTNKSRQQHSAPWITDDIRKLANKRKHLHKKMLKCSSDASLRAEYRHVRSRSTNLIRKAKNTYFREKCRDCKRDPKRLWTTINHLTGRTRHRPEPQVPLSLLHAKFSALSTKKLLPEHPSPSMPEPTASDTLSELRPFTPTRVENLLKDIKPDKASGPDDLPACILRKHSALLAPSLTELFNHSIKLSTVPQAFKVASVTPVYKHGDRTDPSLCCQLSPKSSKSLS